MKKINLYILIIIILFSTISCNDEYLEKYPLDKISDASFWRSADDVKTYANQFYKDLQTAQRWQKIDCNSDNQEGPNRDPYSWNESPVPSTGGGWGKSDWADIRACNIALEKIPDIEGDISQYEGEIRFFKAFYYIKKIKLFGDVPWYDKVLETDSEELFKARDSRKVVITNLLKDLDFAIANLPEKSSDGRLTKYAALALKTNICLYEGTFRKYHGIGDYEVLLHECINAAENIINSGHFSIYATGNPDEDFIKLFNRQDLRDNPEVILNQRFLENVRYHNMPRELAAGDGPGFTKDYVMSYLCTDGLPISISPLYKGDIEFTDEFINRDPRMQQSILHPDRPWAIYKDGSVVYQELPDFAINNSITSYWLIKGFTSNAWEWEQNVATLDVPIYRLAEVLLDYAEAKAELGECTQEVLDKSINLLRDRVNMPHLSVQVGFIDPNWPDWEVPVTPLINEIRRERRIELCSEGKRWDDLVRWKAGKRLENPFTILGARDPDAGGEYRVLYPGFTRKWDDKLYLHPIPTQELTLNPNLIQNPGWAQ